MLVRKKVRIGSAAATGVGGGSGDRGREEDDGLVMVRRRIEKRRVAKGGELGLRVLL